MMGRAKILYHHTRDIRMTLSEKFIQYRIPIVEEKVGLFHSAEVADGFIVVKFFPGKDEDNKFKIQTVEETIHFS